MKHLNRKPDITSKISTLIAQHIEQIRTLEEERPRFVYPFVTEVYKELHVESAHLLPNHDAKCKFLHGHSYKVGITVRGQLWDGIGDTNEGMVLDFKELKQFLKEEVDNKFDHAYLNQVMNVPIFKSNFLERKEMSLRPTAEQMAWFIFVTLYEAFEMRYKDEFQSMSARQIEKYPFEIVQVDVWETTTSKATAKRKYFDYGTYNISLNASAFADDDVKGEFEVFGTTTGRQGVKIYEPTSDLPDWGNPEPMSEADVEEAPTVVETAEVLPEKEDDSEEGISEEVMSFDEAEEEAMAEDQEEFRNNYKPKKRAPKK